MPLNPGTRLGPYLIEAAIGAGGMGEVYRARDTRLDRTVAIKVLPQQIGADPDLRARFEREARMLSSLQHPHICVLHDVGREADVSYVVMQYLDGETLAARLARGPLPLDEALRYAIEIAGALDKAHRAGILHRDLKPGNIMLSKSARRDASATLLDFGLAKLIATGEGPSSGAAPATASSPLTGAGTIVGTLLYMSPEQLEGRDVDARSDIFSFGAVLYEMLAGKRAFDAGSQASIIGAILEREPAPLASVAPLTPPALDRVVRKCLAKDRERRWQTAADLCDELSWIAQASGIQPQAPSAAVVGAPAVRRSRFAVPLAAAVALLLLGLAAAAWSLLRTATDPHRPARHLSITLPDGVRPTAGGIAISPDGESLVFVASPPVPDGAAAGGTGSPPRLYLRRLDSVDVEEIPGTQGAKTPFFSPDGQTIGYFTDNSLNKVSVRAGAPVRISGVPPVSRGAVWLRDGSLLAAPTQSHGFVRVSPEGQAQIVSTPDQAAGELAHFWPQLLPGGEDVLFTIRRGTAENVDNSDIGVFNVATAKWRVILKGAAFAQYSPTGHLLFLRAGTLSVVPFDLASMTAAETATPLIEGLAVDPSVGGAHYAVGPDGSLVFLKGSFGQQQRAAVWLDRVGRSIPVAGLGGIAVAQPRISPDGTRALFFATSPEGDNELYVADLARGTAIRVTDDPRDDFTAVWTPDARRIIWTALSAARMPFLVMRSVDGSGTGEPIVPETTHAQFAGSVSDGGVLAYTRTTDGGASDIWTVTLDAERKPQPLVATGAAEFGPEFSPDGRWLAYVARESGTHDIYVVPYPGPGAKRRVTSTGAASPAWGRDGRELFYQTSEGMMVVDVSPGPEPEFGTPRLLFGGSFFVESAEDGPRSYDVAPGSQRFLMLVAKPSTTPPPAIEVVFDWASEIGRRVIR